MLTRRATISSMIKACGGHRRHIYSRLYLQSPENRGPGMVLSFFSNYHGCLMIPQGVGPTGRVRCLNMSNYTIWLEWFIFPLSSTASTRLDSTSTGRGLGRWNH